jgi:hypothetical protein
LLSPRFLFSALSATSGLLKDPPLGSTQEKPGQKTRAEPTKKSFTASLQDSETQFGRHLAGWRKLNMGHAKRLIMKRSDQQIKMSLEGSLKTMVGGFNFGIQVQLPYYFFFRRL